MSFLVQARVPFLFVCMTRLVRTARAGTVSRNDVIHSFPLWKKDSTDRPAGASSSGQPRAEFPVQSARVGDVAESAFVGRVGLQEREQFLFAGGAGLRDSLAGAVVVTGHGRQVLRRGPA